MIVRCPACRKSFRLDDARFRAGAKMRCSSCGMTFQGSGSAAVEGAAAGATGPEAAAPAPASVSARPKAAAAPPGGETLVLLADAGRPFRGVLLPILRGLGCVVETVEDGTEAFRIAVARRPAAMIVSVHLAGLSGVAICEGVKGSPHLRVIRVALVGSDLSSDLFNRDTALAYGADAFLDEEMEPDSLREQLESLLRGDGTAGASKASSRPRGDIEPGAAIRRLARLMLSDLRLYNPDRFERALKENRLLDTFKEELAKGRELVDHRFPQIAARHELLAKALREGIERERTGARPGE